MNARRTEDGVALILSLIVLLALSALVLAFMSASVLEPRIARNLGDTARARWLAEAGIEVGYSRLIASADPDDSWTSLLAGATPEAPWVPLPSLNSSPLPGFTLAEGMCTVSIRNDSAPGDAALTGEALVDVDAARDTNGVVVMRSTGTFNGASRTIEAVVRRHRTLGSPAAGNRVRHALSNWRER
jgi:Tfp pilus assembly protein PilX